jgi:23S rRNA (uracil1939-C5)-methyltransferase
VRNRNKIQPVYTHVTISDIGAEGKSIARINDMVVFTTYAIPGDIVDLQVTRKKKRYLEAKILRYHQLSPLRRDPFCVHFGVCGGCKWQHLEYGDQLRYKQKQVEDQLQRIGKTEIPAVCPILGSDKTTFYRNKLEFTFSNNRWLTDQELHSAETISNRNALGFHIPGLFDKVLPIEKCWLQPDPSNQVRNFIFNYAEEHRLSFFDIRKQEGFLRTLIIRNSSSGGLMVIVTFYFEDREKREGLLEALQQNFPEITSLMYVINNKGNDTITDQEVILFSGEDHIWEEMEGLRFKVGPKSFYQTNSDQAWVLYKVAREFAALKGNETVYDLYTGTGTIANFVAQSCNKVVGIEYVPEAIDDARLNAEVNHLTNTTFFSGDIKNILNSEFFGIHGKPDVVITDPPRAGMHEDVVKAIMEAGPERIVYVSCNPATQARDIAWMTEHYTVEKIQPVDMFPHTHHVENVVLLVKKNQEPTDEHARSKVVN